MVGMKVLVVDEDLVVVYCRCCIRSASDLLILKVVNHSSLLLEKDHWTIDK